MNSHSRYLSILTLLIVLVAATAGAHETSASTKVTVRTLEPQTVLYTIHRGSYWTLGEAFGRLYGLAMSKDLQPTSETMSVHLNNPQGLAPAHWLTEVRIIVPKSALRHAGTLGSLTDIKTVPEVKVAVAVKPAGVKTPEKIGRDLYAWIYQHGYASIDAPMQRVIGGSKTHNYTQMEVEMLVPVAKPADIIK
jgi:DNA gyrase inhibitor GyrI